MKDGLTQVKELKDKIHEQYIEIQELNKENDRLKNIINELEKWLYERSEYTNFGVVIDKLQELKGSNGAIPPEVIGTNGENGGLFDYGDR